MTLPASGYPDFQAITSWRSDDLVSETFTPNAGQILTRGPFVLTNYGSVYLKIRANLNGASVRLMGENTLTGNYDILIKSWPVRPETEIQVTFPIYDRRVQLEVESQSALASIITVQMIALNVATDRVHYRGDDVSYTVFANVIAPGITQTFYPSNLLPGPALWWINSSAGTAAVTHSIKRRNNAGTSAGFVTQRVVTVANETVMTMLPSQIWMIEVFNGDAVNRTYSFSITPQAPSL